MCDSKSCIDKLYVMVICISLIKFYHQIGSKFLLSDIILRPSGTYIHMNAWHFAYKLNMYANTSAVSLLWQQFMKSINPMAISTHCQLNLVTSSWNFAAFELYGFWQCNFIIDSLQCNKKASNCLSHTEFLHHNRC